MKRVKYVFLITMLTCLVRPVSYGQTSHEMVIPDFYATGHYLNEDIVGDSTSTGARKDPDRIYVLKRGGIYLVNTLFRNDGWTLRIKAENASGRKPALYTFKNSTTGTYPTSVIQARGSLWLKNLALIGWPEFMPTEISLGPSYIIDVQGIGYRIEIDSCIFSGTKSSIQIAVATPMVKVTNCLFAQNGNFYNGSFGDGRPIDCRSTSVDTLFVQNCTSIDRIDRLIRHYSSTGPIGVLFFDHNTSVNGVSYHGCIALGFVGRQVTITNNLFVDNFIFGNDSTDAARLAEFGDSRERSPSGAFRMTFVSSVPNDTTKWIIKNNFYSVTPALQAFYDTHTREGYGNLVPLTWHINSKIGSDSVNAFKKDAITLTKSTHDLVPLALWYNDPNGANKKKANTNFNAALDFYRPQWPYYVDTLNLSYQTTAQAYTGAAGGFPAGDLNWFATRKSAWLLVDVEKPVAGVPASFALSQNYPNPFNPTTALEYSISKSSNVVLEVFNVLGQSVAKLVDEHQAPGTYRTSFDGAKLSSGVYLYRLKAGDFVQTRKMVLMK
ncbi:MAG: T9SS type A sorting domain-containing protein [Ignavibacteriales bacterium]|nr:T9SS type A sorting domain-containing protein [Ignavibacteriales bacterium]